MAEALPALPKATSTNTAVKARVLPLTMPLERSREPETMSIDQAARKLGLHLRSGVEHSYRQVSRAMRGTWDQSRRRFHHISREHPLRLVMGVGVAAFIAGAALRIWRSNHD
ncbi:MAG TPA: hypothetical protein VL156_00660 [Terriglobales bacterium]|nr:hypothetical protein [Terriglobales bacterium]